MNVELTSYTHTHTHTHTHMHMCSMQCVCDRGHTMYDIRYVQVCVAVADGHAPIRSTTFPHTLLVHVHAYMFIP